MEVLQLAMANEYSAVKAPKQVEASAIWKMDSYLSETNIYELLVKNRKDSLFVDEGCIPKENLKIPSAVKKNVSKVPP